MVFSCSNGNGAANLVFSAPRSEQNFSSQEWKIYNFFLRRGKICCFCSNGNGAH